MNAPLSPVQWKDGTLLILDQRALPRRMTWIRARRAETVAKAIESLAIRGAPLIGIAAAYAMALEAARPDATERQLRETLERLRGTRPTGFNLFAALAEMDAMLSGGARGLSGRMLRKAKELHRRDAHSCLTMAEHGIGIMKRGERVLTYCNTGSLATGGIGTALGVVKTGYRRGKIAEVFACETRPIGQGARLTAWECATAGIPVTLICDNMAAALMASGKVDRVLVGADRIAANGDTSNKIGTLSLATTARAFRIPFHVVAPLSTFDSSLPNGKRIPIEQRNAAEVTAWIGDLDRLRGIQVWNPAFDVTPARFIASFITECGILRPPFEFSSGSVCRK
ncbi:MAG: S-methyl-5-thioribose-1-phosphate isomerase [bacterium]|nr:S-methyl-5-thioribose-1-phosphate isomerase [bacterium]